MGNILVCDDDKEIARAIGIYLEEAGYQVVLAYNGEEAIDCLANIKQIDLVIMDIMMPGLDGIEATKRIREENNIPIIMLSAKSEDEDKIAGLRIGADDYITKPFNPEELVARVQSQLRRAAMMIQQPKGEKTPKLTVGGLSLSEKDNVVNVDGRQVHLTPLEFNILKLLVQHAGQVFSSAEIYEKIWNDRPVDTGNLVAVHVRHIREKIEINTREPRYLKVIWGVGYKIEAENE
ncbi:MAG: response regulator transcription factor [Lachnospiraceae bacterium]|nr:response regulator transcription factor [Lachnospiraceae bacterium]